MRGRVTTELTLIIMNITDHEAACTVTGVEDSPTNIATCHTLREGWLAIVKDCTFSMPEPLFPEFMLPYISTFLGDDLDKF